MSKIASVIGVVSLLALVIPVRADEDATVREVVAKAIKAHGGIENLTKYKGSVSKQKGKVHVLGQVLDFTSENCVQMPDRIHVEVHSKFGDQEFTVIQVVDSNKGWIKVGDKTDAMTKEMLEEAKEQLNAANISHLACLNDKGYKLSPLGEVNVGDRPAIGVRVERKGYRDVSVFFDKEKGLLLKMETRGKDVMQDGQEYTSTSVYSDHKEVDGMMTPHKIVIERDGKPYVEGEVTEMRNSEKLDDSEFQKP